MAIFLRTFPPYTADDDAATTFESCAIVFLYALIFDTEDPATLAELAALPLDFVWIVCGKASQTGFWSSDALVDLAENLLSGNLPDLKAVNEYLQDTMEDFWRNVWRPQFLVVLNRLRAGILVGGRRQDWTDDGFEEEFGILLRPAIPEPAESQQFGNAWERPSPSQN